jgi:undecaprenyl diphosphate synthase
MIFKSSTATVPEAPKVPRHIAIIMDGNGRWATKRLLPRVAGHVKGVDAVRKIVEACVERGVDYLTLFAFSSENWRRPADEVSYLMSLFVSALEREVSKMHANNIRLKVVGDLSRFDPKLQDMIASAERRTANNTRLTVSVCANYGGRWDIMQATSKMVAANPGLTEYTEEMLAPHLAMAYAPEPPPVAARLFGAVLHRRLLAGFLAGVARYGDRFLPEPGAPLRPHRRAGRY